MSHKHMHTHGTHKGAINHDHMGAQSAEGSKTLLGMKQLSPKEKGSGLPTSASDVEALGEVSSGDSNS